MKKLILVLVCAVFSVSASAQTQKTYRSNREFSEGLKRVGNADGSGNNIYGFVNEAGEEVIPLQYDDASSFSDGLAHAYIKNKCGLIDKTGKQFVPFIYDIIGAFREDMAAVKLNNKWGFIDRKTGKPVITPKYDDANDFHEGMAAVKLNNKWGFIDKAGKKIISLKYDYVGDFRSDYAGLKFVKVKLNGAEFYIDQNEQHLKVE